MSEPRARRARIEIDGRLDEPAWRTAEVATHFVERTPTPRAEPPVQTRFRVLFDDDAIYVGAEMDLLPGERPRGFELRRDSFEAYADDVVTLKLDVARDRRTTVGFAVSAANTQLDYVAVDNGRTFRREFDAVWESATSIGDTSWIAEIRIPLTALGIPGGAAERVLGFDVTRNHNARFATDDWAYLPPENGPVSALHYGDLEGVSIGGGIPITAIPYALFEWATVDDGPPEDGLRGSAGGDVRLRLGADVWSELTVLTDFAEVDLDDPVVNLDRFPLFFDERRPFFINGLDVFAFGEEGASQLLFSRRIGLDEDAQRVPMWGGLKLYGHAGPIGFGLLDVMTGEPNSNWGVARIRGNVGEAGYLGAMLTTKNDLERPDDDGYAAGIDGTLRFLEGERLQLSGSFAGTDDAFDEGAIPEDHASATGSISYLGHTFRPSVRFLYVGDEYAPPAGFVRRNGVASASADFTYVAFPEALEMSSISTTLRAALQTTDELDERVGGTVGLGTSLDWPSWGFDASASLVEDVVTDAFVLLDRFDIEPGAYAGVAMEYGLYASSTLNPYGSIRYRGSSAFFGGTIQTVTIDAGVALGPHLRVTASADQSFVKLPNVDVESVLTLSSTVTVAVSTRLFADIVVQLNDYDESTRGLVRLRWRYLPGSDLFVVYRQDVGYDGAYEGSITVKLAYRIDALL